MNKTEISGELIRLDFSHETHGKRFFAGEIKILRMSGCADIIPIVVPEEHINRKKHVRVTGRIRTRITKNGRRKVYVYLFVDHMEECKEVYENSVELLGRIAKPTVYRITPLGRDITEVLLEIERPYGKKDYIPCICWGEDAKNADDLWVGTKVFVEGRFQSRNYIKGEEIKTTHEVSVKKIEVIEHEQIRC